MAENENGRVVIYGARGSIPVSGAEYATYGGATSCVMLRAAGEVILLDAGSGLMKLSHSAMHRQGKVHLFLSHYHLDHIMGLTMSPLLFDPQIQVVVCTPAPEEGFWHALKSMMAPPLWPVGPEVFRADVVYMEPGQWNERLSGKGIRVSALPVAHPGGAWAYRFDWAGRSLVYATDCELDEAGAGKLAAFAREADLFIMDGQYFREEYGRCAGFGHTHTDMAAKVIVDSRAKRGLLYHHAPGHDDGRLEEQERRLGLLGERIGLAREGDIIEL